MNLMDGFVIAPLGALNMFNIFRFLRFLYHDENIVDEIMLIETSVDVKGDNNLSQKCAIVNKSSFATSSTCALPSIIVSHTRGYVRFAKTMS